MLTTLNSRQALSIRFPVKFCDNSTLIIRKNPVITGGGLTFFDINLPVHTCRLGEILICAKKILIPHTFADILPSAVYDGFIDLSRFFASTSARAPTIGCALIMNGKSDSAPTDNIL